MTEQHGKTYLYGQSRTGNNQKSTEIDNGIEGARPSMRISTASSYEFHERHLGLDYLRGVLPG